jgi:hypothetical protein
MTLNKELDTHQNFLPDNDFRPSAARLIDSLRDTGYSPEAAFADVIDNAIAAQATRVCIELTYMYGDVRVTFLDNGVGMTEDELRSAMRYGSPKRDNPKSLGKFGMGLKTASTAFCERLAVMSLKNGAASIRAWDIDTIRKKDLWHLETPEWENYYDDKYELEEFAKETGSATMVVWEKVDRLVTLNNNNKIEGLLRELGIELCEELSAVFARFLDITDTDFPNVSITMKIGEDPVRILLAWDPLCLALNRESESKRIQPLPKKHVTVTLANNEGAQFTLTGSILPVQNDLTPEEQKRVRYSLDNQGFYIYREGRLIWHEGWPQRMYKKEGKITRLRVVLDFTHELDDLFKIDFRKSRIIIPAAVRKQLQSIVAPWRNQTLRASSNKEIDASPGSDDGVSHRHQRATNAIGKHLEQTKSAEVSVEDGRATLRNKFNINPVEIEGIHIYEESKGKRRAIT